MPANRDLNTELTAINGQSNTFAGQNVTNQGQYGPQLTNLNLANYNTALRGSFDAGAFDAANPGFLAEFQKQQAAGELQGWTPEQFAAAYTGKPANDPSLNQFYTGGAASLARDGYAMANPGLVNYTGGLQSVMDGLNARTPGPVATSTYSPTLAGSHGYDVATASPTLSPEAILADYRMADASPAALNTADGGSLLSPLESSARGNLDQLSPIQKMLQDQALGDLGQGGMLGGADLRQAQQASRAAMSARGLALGPNAAADEILNSDALSRQRLNERRAFAAATDAAGQTQLNTGRNYALAVQGQGQNLSQFNASQGNAMNQFNSSLLADTSKFNAGAYNANSQFNAGQKNAMAQFNTGQGNSMAQFNTGQLNAGGQFNSSLLSNTSQFNAGAANTAGQFNAGATNNMGQYNGNLAAGSLNDQWNRAMGYGGLQLAQAQNPGALAGSLAGSTPDYTNSLLSYGSDLNNTNFNGAVSAANTASNNSAAKTSALVQGGSSLVMAKLMFMCIPEGQRIDTPHGGVAIEHLRAGARVVGYDGMPVFVVQKHEYLEDPEQKRFVCLQFAGKNQSLMVCDKHRIEGKPAAEWNVGDEVGGRRIKAKSWHGGVSRSYDILTSDVGYRIHGVPVNSMIEEMASVAGSLN